MRLDFLLSLKQEYFTTLAVDQNSCYSCGFESFKFKKT